MNIYLVKRTDEIGYNQWEALVCFAENENEARLTHPSSEEKWSVENNYWINPKYGQGKDMWHGWTENLASLQVTLVGVGEGENRSVILDSFNAG